MLKQEIGWINLAQDRDRWKPLLNSVINRSFHKMLGISQLAEELLPSQKRFCSMKFVSNSDYGTTLKGRMLYGW